MWHFKFTDAVGESFMYGEKCRIKHLPSQKYLATEMIAEEYAVVLCDSICIGGEVFTLVPLNSDRISQVYF